jgi:hypothetical protein
MPPKSDQAEAVKQARKAKPKGDRNRIVVEGLDDRLDTGERGKYSDRVKIDPFAPGYKWPIARRPISRG